MTKAPESKAARLFTIPRAAIEVKKTGDSVLCRTTITGKVTGSAARKTVAEGLDACRKQNAVMKGYLKSDKKDKASKGDANAKPKPVKDEATKDVEAWQKRRFDIIDLGELPLRLCLLSLFA